MTDQKEQTSTDATDQLPGKGAGTEDVKGAGDKVEGKAGDESERTYSSEEFRRMQSSKDETFARKEQTFQETLSRAEAEKDTLTEQLEREKGSAYLKKVEADGGDIERARTVIEREIAANARERATTAKLAKVDAVARVNEARSLAAEFNLDADAAKALLEAKTPAEMETKALRLALAKTLADKTPAQKIADEKTSPKGVDFSNMSPEQRMAWAFENEPTVKNK